MIAKLRIHATAGYLGDTEHKGCLEPPAMWPRAVRSLPQGGGVLMRTLDRRVACRLLSAGLLAGCARVPPSCNDDLVQLVREGLTVGFPAVGIRAVAPGGLVLEAVHGLADLRLGVPATSEHRFLIFSITKTFVATVIHQLIDEGRLGQDDLLLAVLQDPTLRQVANADQVTIRQLLDHTSGIADIFDSPEFRAATNGSAADLNRYWTPYEIIRHAFGKPPAAEPGTDQLYSNTNYNLLGLVAEKLLQASLGEIIEERITRPLRLASTQLIDARTHRPPRMRGYMADLPMLREAGFDAPFPSASPSLLDCSALNYSYEWAAGGIVSTLRDLTTFADALFSARLVSARALERMQQFRSSPAALDAGEETYGMGLAALATPVGIAVGHTGDGPGFTTFMLRHLETGVIVVAYGSAAALPGADDYFLKLFAGAVSVARARGG